MAENPLPVVLSAVQALYGMVRRLCVLVVQFRRLNSLCILRQSIVKDANSFFLQCIAGRSRPPA
jgi:hypothetical protein